MQLSTLQYSTDCAAVAVPSLAVMLGSAFQMRLFIPCKKLDLPKRLIPL